MSLNLFRRVRELEEKLEKLEKRKDTEMIVPPPIPDLSVSWESGVVAGSLLEELETATPYESVEEREYREEIKRQGAR